MPGPCLCGDPACVFCGCGDPGFDRLCCYLLEVVLADLPPIIDGGALAEDLASRFSRAASPDLIEALDQAAREWERNQADERRRHQDAQRFRDQVPTLNDEVPNA